MLQKGFYVRSYFQNQMQIGIATGRCLLQRMQYTQYCWSFRQYFKCNSNGIEINCGLMKTYQQANGRARTHHLFCAASKFKTIFMRRHLTNSVNNWLEIYKKDLEYKILVDDELIICVLSQEKLVKNFQMISLWHQKATMITITPEIFICHYAHWNTNLL